MLIKATKTALEPSTIKTLMHLVRLEKEKMLEQCSVKAGEFVMVTFQGVVEVSEHKTLKHPIKKRKAYVKNVAVTDDGDLDITLMRVNKNGSVSQHEDHFHDSIYITRIDKA